MKNWVPDMSWERDVEVFDRVIEEEAADAARRSADAVNTQRREIEFELAAEVDQVAAERGHARPDSHDVALSRANVATRLGLQGDREEIAAILGRDPEPLEAASPVERRPGLRRARPPVDDQAFDAHLATIADGLRALARLHAHRRPSAMAAATERSLRSIRGAIDTLLEPGDRTRLLS